jgi:hypothetical protein
MYFGFVSIKIINLASSTMIKYLCNIDANEIEVLYSHIEILFLFHFISNDYGIEVTH